MRSSIVRLSPAVLLLFFAACGDDSSGSDDDGGAGGGGSGSGASGPGCSEPTAVPCEDEVILQMNLQADPAPGVISNTPEGSGWVSVVDATAGGAFAADPHSYVYARFTAAGLEKVALSDEDSLGSMDWDIAFRRYVVRINSKNSGPSCVAAARVPGTPAYDTLAVDLATLTFREDEYFTASCEIIADGTGLEGSPATALSSYWTYPGCVKMSGNVFVVRPADGQLYKLTVTNFYNDAAQQQCQDTGAVPMTDNGSANIRVRWAAL